MLIHNNKMTRIFKDDESTRGYGQNSAWDYNAEIKTILSKLGINDTTKR